MHATNAEGYKVIKGYQRRSTKLELLQPTFFKRGNKRERFECGCLWVTYEVCSQGIPLGESKHMVLDEFQREIEVSAHVFRRILSILEGLMTRFSVELQ